ncbi:MAG: isochorismate synthase [Drouetiella hepatica Uher 2000/2452]|jgi:menaquinone-specific isochorismate synthase|uniref:isochorismate synthase n=1 Tax=Drouetiella hepatica Uher 2000/2452 TaxID=904376 RepID=A0A951Q6M2_9CYAN|nr:isochorismate synthase [Drouetiella hepatica Uher 2000/2452]
MQCQSAFTGLSLFQDCQQLYQFLDFCQRKSIEDEQSKIASVFLEIDAIDPLAVLDQWSKPHQLHFYFENREQEWAIAAIDAAMSFEVSGSHRFLAVQQFVQTCFNQLIASSTSNFPGAVPRFFCSFAFFDQAAQDAEHTEITPAFAPATAFLPQWQVMRWRDRSAILANFLIHPQSNLEDVTQAIWHQAQAISATPSHPFNFSHPMLDLLNRSEALKRWQIIDTFPFSTAVASALLDIQQQHFHKLVLAHAIDVVSGLPFQIGRSLHNLRQRYPDCHVFSTGNGRGQSFIGASPERLLSIQNQLLTTDALAGSAPRGKTTHEDRQFARQLMSSDKEQREHRVVVDFITERLAALGLVPQRAIAPVLLPLSNIQHLHTPIQAAFPTDRHPLEILAALHPTPAVAGMPRIAACQQIQRYEQFERSLYAAPLGWVDAQGNAEFIVGIRSALLQGNRARLYAGAGIVAGSEPEREFAEVRLKLQALLQALI